MKAFIDFNMMYMTEANKPSKPSPVMIAERIGCSNDEPNSVASTAKPPSIISITSSARLLVSLGNGNCGWFKTAFSIGMDIIRL